MKFKFNGGRGAILCGKCGVILKSGSEIPDYVWDAVRNGTVNELPDMYCEDDCKHSMEVLAKTREYIEKMKNNKVTIK